MSETITYALDSNILSYFLRKTNGIDTQITAALNNGHKVKIPPIAYYEVSRGLKYTHAIKQLSVFEELSSYFGIGKIDQETLMSAADIYVDLRNNGTLVEDADILTAAYCIRNDYTLVTHNTKHFANIQNLKYTDWVQI